MEPPFHTPAIEDDPDNIGTLGDVFERQRSGTRFSVSQPGILALNDPPRIGPPYDCADLSFLNFQLPAKNGYFSKPRRQECCGDIVGASVTYLRSMDR